MFLSKVVPKTLGILSAILVRSNIQTENFYESAETWLCLRDVCKITSKKIRLHDDCGTDINRIICCNYKNIRYGQQIYRFGGGGGVPL